ncbi:MAG: ADP-glyceromanno-heptose 6-epimerase [Planctomycetes bacterium]|nr:ADP-glyceromanno-heptose 6-epimerase [Planctomycetota bacterium]MBU1517805.1 ADP-glyceromanno-heptose 6-epimerase [Planctomycetota bacterium]
MIIITGGAGFIGSAIVAALNAKGIRDILIVDTIAEPGNCPNLRNLSFADYLSADDFLSQITAGRFNSPVDAVFHLGACSSTTETDTAFLTKNNVEYSKSVAAFALDKKARLVHASSAATYGDGSNGFSDDHAKLRTLQPLNPYGQSKQDFDLWALDNGMLEKIVALKYFNVFGPNEYHKADMRSFVLKGYEQIKQTGKVCLFKSHNPDYKDGCQMRDFLYVKDAVDMTLFFLAGKIANGVFNIGSGQARTWLDLANALFAAMNLKPDIEFIDMPEILRDKYQYFTQADISKLRAAGCKSQITSLENAVKDYVQNYLVPNRYLSA